MSLGCLDPVATRARIEQELIRLRKGLGAMGRS